MATVEGRIGVSWDNYLLFGKGGWAGGNASLTLVSNGNANAGTAGDVATTSEFVDGWTIGGGIEAAFDPIGLFGRNWTVKTEYLYVDLGRSSDSYTYFPGTVSTFSTQVREHVFRTGLNYHFNAPVVARY